MIISRFMSHHLFTLHRFTFYCFIFLLPWQTIWIMRDVFYGTEKWQFGTIGIYGADIFLIIWICLSIYLYHERIIHFCAQRLPLIVSALTVVIWSFFSILWAADTVNALYGALLLSFAIDLFILVQIIPLHIRSVMMIFVVSACMQSAIGLWQFITQSTLGNALLGMQSHMITWGGTATISNDGERWLRAYGAMPHPNMLSALLLIALLLAIYLSITAKQKNQHFLLLLCIGILSAGIIVTFSRTVWYATLLIVPILAIISFIRETPPRHHMLIPFITIAGVGGMMITVLFPLIMVRTIQHTQLSHNSIGDRTTYLYHAHEIVSAHPLIGTGIRNYTNTVFDHYNAYYPIWSIQPVHNIYILTLAELGMIGMFLLVIFGAYLIKSTIYTSPHQKKQRLFLYGVMCSIIVIGLFDHWPWSSHFGILTTLLFLGLMLRGRIIQSPLQISSPSTQTQ